MITRLKCFFRAAKGEDMAHVVADCTGLTRYLCTASLQPSLLGLFFSSPTITYWCHRLNILLLQSPHQHVCLVLWSPLTGARDKCILRSIPNLFFWLRRVPNIKAEPLFLEEKRCRRVKKNDTGDQGHEYVGDKHASWGLLFGTGHSWVSLAPESEVSGWCEDNISHCWTHGSRRHLGWWVTVSGLSWNLRRKTRQTPSSRPPPTTARASDGLPPSGWNTLPNGSHLFNWTLNSLCWRTVRYATQSSDLFHPRLSQWLKRNRYLPLPSDRG